MRVTFTGEMQSMLPLSEPAPEMRSVTTMVRRDLHRGLSIMAIDEDTTIQDLVNRAISDYLDAHTTPGGSASKPSYRAGKKAHTTWVNEAALRQFKAIAAEEGKTIQELVEEMLNREFERRGKAPLA